MKKNILTKKPNIKRYCRLMEYTKEGDSNELSFLVSSKRNFSISLSNEELQIFRKIDGHNTIAEIKQKTNFSLEKILNLIEKFSNKNVITYNSDDKKYQFDRHDLYFDMCFNKKNFTRKNISNKRIMVVGAGGIGNNVIILLIRMGFKDIIIIIDNDKIELSNLTRQFMFEKDDIGKNKIFVLNEKIKKFDKNIKTILVNEKFNRHVFETIEKENFVKKIDFVIVSADTPTTIAIDAYNIFTNLEIPYTTVGYLNDFSIFGPIIYKKNKKYEDFINILRSDKRKSKIIHEQNKTYQSPSFGPINMFSASNAISDMIRFLNDKNMAISLEKKIIFNFNNLEKQIIDFTDEKTKIGIFSSSSDLGSKLQNRVKRSKQILEDNGFIVNLGNLWNKSIGYTTASPIQRAAEFNNLVDSNDILMSMIGGMNSSSILPHIDYEKIIKKNIKIVGFSDTTSILLAVFAKTGIPVFYGPALLPSFDEQEYIRNWNIDSLKKYIEKSNLGKIKNPLYWTEEKIDWFKAKNGNEKKEKHLIKNKLTSINDAVVIGRLIGGNLNTMVSIYNTEFMPEIKEGDILFFEDSNKSIDECERNFAFLKNSKILNKVAGVIIGKCEAFNSLGSNDTYESLFLKFLDHKIPILFNYDCSHCLPMNILKIGAKIKLDTFKKELHILE